MQEGAFTAHIAIQVLLPRVTGLFMENIMKPLSLFFLCLLLAGSIAMPAHAETREQLVIPAGSRPSSTASAQNFTGSVRVDPAFETLAPQRAYGSHVTFEPGARTNWHTPPLGQTLLVTFGTGPIQEWGGPIQIIRQGDVVLCPPNVKHWHGAAPDVAMTHLAIGERLDGKSATWMEKVADEQYQAQ